LLGATLYGATLSANYLEVRKHTIAFAYDGGVLDGEDVKTEIKWNIYPNPVVGMLHITGLEGFYTIKIVDTVGQVVTSIKGTSTELELDMSGKPAGMYLIKIESQGRTLTRKLIKK